VEEELERHDSKVDQVRKEVQAKEDHNRELGRQIEALNGQNHFANMAVSKV